MTVKEKVAEIAKRSEAKLATIYGCRELEDVKNLLCKEIAEYYGEFDTDGSKLYVIVDCVYEYNSPEDLLIDWLDTLIESSLAGDGGIWDDEIEYIYTAILKKHPTNIVPHPGKKKGTRWMATYNMPKIDGSGKTYQIVLGSFSSVTDAISARDTYVAAIEDDQSIDAASEAVATALKHRLAKDIIRFYQEYDWDGSETEDEKTLVCDMQNKLSDPKSVQEIRKRLIEFCENVLGISDPMIDNLLNRLSTYGGDSI